MRITNADVQRKGREARDTLREFVPDAKVSTYKDGARGYTVAIRAHGGKWSTQHDLTTRESYQFLEGLQAGAQIVDIKGNA